MVVTHRLQIMQWFPLFYTLLIELRNHDQAPIFGAAWKRTKSGIFAALHLRHSVF